MKNKFLTSRKNIFIVAALLIILGGGVWAFANLYNQPENNEQPTELPGIASGDATDDAQESDTSEAQSNKSNTQNEPGPSESQSNKSVSITALYYDNDSKKVIVRAITENVTSGTCEVVFKKSGQRDVKTTGSVSIVTSYYECQGLDTPKSSFPTTGKWSAAVTLSSGGASVSSSTRQVTVL